MEQMSFLAAALIAFGVILLVELPDKTLVASLVLSTRYRPRWVLIGVAAAFAVQCVIAAAAGGLITLLPRRAVEAVVAALFALGAVLLIRESLGPDDDVELAEARENLPFWRVVGTSFGVLFAAEWGDASQIATAGLVARRSGVGHAVATAVGAWVALVAVATVAVVAGRVVVRRVPLRLVHRVAGLIFAVFAALAGVAAATG
jgi:putative Ca2+/H+ antiporter (TMEM165/GDT1 family)